MAGWQGVVSGGESARDSARGRTRVKVQPDHGGPGGSRAPFSTWLPPWLAKADSGSYWYFASVYISIVRRKQAEKALASSAFFSGLWLRE